MNVLVKNAEVKIADFDITILEQDVAKDPVWLSFSLALTPFKEIQSSGLFPYKLSLFHKIQFNM